MIALKIHSIESESNSHNLTNLMHRCTLQELYKMNSSNQLAIKSIKPEQTVLLDSNSKTPRIGRYDFLVECASGKSRFLGIEVLSRPTRGKLRQKLSYTNSVDEFVFVLPENSLGFYRKPKQKVFHKEAKTKSFGKEFASEKLYVWLFDQAAKSFKEKGRFAELFNVVKR